jgi:tetratricopeptide (TPR) repeat protein
LELFFKALEIRERVLGEEHTDTAATYCNIGLVYDRKGDHDEALKWHFKDLKISEKVLGEEHPYTKGTLESLEITYEKINNPEPFDEWLKRHV